MPSRTPPKSRPIGMLSPPSSYFPLAYLRVKRYAVISAFSRSLRCKAGINEPGLNVSGFAIHAFRFCALFAIMPAAKVSRLMRCVRLGPIRPNAAVPDIV